MSFSDTPNSTWHPALMPESTVLEASSGESALAPNSDNAAVTESVEAPTSATDPESPHVADGHSGFGRDTGGHVSQAQRKEQVPSSIEEVDVEATQTETAPVESRSVPPNLDAKENTEQEAWFGGENNHDDDWLAQADEEVAPTNEESLGHDNEAGSPDPSSEGADDPIGKRASSMSFARTVSHEVNFNDDEEPEWTVSRTETDPFKFMPPSDRTNSFPPVPPLERQYEHESSEQPLPPTQAQEVIQEAEEDGLHSASSGAQMAQNLPRADTFGAADRLNGDCASQQYVGGDLSGSHEDDSVARFEEGVPLIPRATDSGSPAKQPIKEQEQEEEDSFFARDTGADDDFFGQIGDSGNSGSREGSPRPLERKSTTQVLNSLQKTPGANQLITSFEQDENGESVKSTPITPFPDVPVHTGAEQSNESSTKPAGGDDISAKWQEAFAGDDDEDFLLGDDAQESKEMDPAAFFGSDDEGFLEDAEETPEVQQPPVAAHAAPPTNGMNGLYTPVQQTPVQIVPPQAPAFGGGYTPAPQPTASPFYGAAPAPAPSAPPPLMGSAYGAQPPRPQPSSAQSFAAKSKGGYQSPYDLPMEVVKPKKRPSMQHLPRSQVSSALAPGPPPPVRSVSMYNQPSPTSNFSAPPANPSTATLPPLTVPGPHQKPPPQPLRSKDSFFEELPVSSKPRPGSRHSNHSVPSPSQATPFAPPQVGQVAQSSAANYMPPHPPHPPQPTSYSLMHSVPSPASAQHGPSRESSSGFANLVAPERLSPYAPSHSNSIPVPSAPPSNISRYSPAPPQVPVATTSLPPAATSRYSPAPPPGPAGIRQMAPPSLPHLPRTSSPLAHFEVHNDKLRSASSTNGDGNMLDRRSSSSSLYRLNRVPSLPPTREVEEEEAAPPSGGAASTAPQGLPAQDLRHSPMYQPRKTPPPATGPPPQSQNLLSPPKRSLSSYMPPTQPAVESAKEHELVPPQRSQTQSPGALHGKGLLPQIGTTIPRPSSAYAPESPRATGPPASAPPPRQARHNRSRGSSLTLSFVTPTDGREQDQLQRWRGSPLISWGVGGTLVTFFPKDIPRYTNNVPMVFRSPGEVKIKNVKDIQPLEERLAKFPGPLKGKSKKKETVAWLASGIEILEKDLPRPSLQSPPTHEEKRDIERVLLWKILRVFVEHDGALDSDAAVSKTVREILAPSIDTIKPGEGPAAYVGGNMGPPSMAQADAVDSSAVEELRKHLVLGDREKAVWAAVDKRLWGHAFLVSNTVSSELYKKVAQEFVRKEVNQGHNNESLAALYEVLSGNHDDSVDELVPMHARAGLQLMATDTMSGTSKGGLDGIDKWQETLCLILSNRSPDDSRAMNALGNLLSGYGRAEAAHICFMFARKHAVFGGLDNPNSSFVLVGSDHRGQAQQFCKEVESLLLSEVYEYGLSLSGGVNYSAGCPHLAAYKLQHALTLAEYGYRDKALQYCEALYASMSASVARSPYYHIVLETAVDELLQRLRQVPKESSNSWISKPSMNKVSDSVWNKFNKFVSGEDNAESGAGPSGEGSLEPGPFSRIAGGSPVVSRPPSAGGDVIGGQSASYPMASGPMPPSTRAASRYAPTPGTPGAQTGHPESSNPYAPAAGQYTPQSGRRSMENSSPESNRGSFQITRQDSMPQLSKKGSFTRNYTPPPLASAVAHAPQLQAATSTTDSSYMPYHPSEEPLPAPPQSGNLPLPSPYGQQSHAGSVGNRSPYTPNFAPNHHGGVTEHQPSYGGYEPPSLSTQPAPSEETPAEPSTVGGYEPPSYQPYGFEAPSYEPDPAPLADDEDSLTLSKPKKKSFMDDDEDDIPALNSREKSKEEKDRENAEMFRKIAEEEAKRAEEEKKAKKSSGWGLTGWFGGGKKESLEERPKPVRAKLGEKNSFYYDPDQKRWVNKSGGAEDNAPKMATPPPPRGGTPRSAAGTPPPPAATPMGLSPPRSLHPGLTSMASSESLRAPPPMLMPRAVSNGSATGPPSAPPSRPGTSMSNASSIDDLLGAAAAGSRKGAKKAKKGGRYVDVMAK